MLKPLARYATLTGYVQLSRSLGLDPVRLLRAVDLDPSGLDLQDRWVPAASIVQLLEMSATESGCEDFALKLAEHRRLSTLGPLAMAIREEPDARGAIARLIHFQHAYNESIRISTTEGDGLSTIVVDIDPGEPLPVRRSVELAMAVLHQVLTTILGDTWRPVAVTFTHDRPADDSTHRWVFGAPRFGQALNSVVMYTADLDRPNRDSDPGLRPYADQVLSTLPTRETSTAEGRVRELVEILLPTGRCSIDQVALSLGVDRRTVHRHLARSGVTFTSITDDVRAELATRLVGGDLHSFTEISEMLSFSTPSSFSRWFSRLFGMSPRQWRKHSQTGAEPEGVSREVKKSVPKGQGSSDPTH